MGGSWDTPLMGNVGESSMGLGFCGGVVGEPCAGGVGLSALQPALILDDLYAKPRFTMRGGKLVT